MDDYTMEDLEAVLYYYDVVNTQQNAWQGAFGSEHRKMTMEQAIVFDDSQFGLGPKTKAEIAEATAKYQHGKFLASKCLLVESSRRTCADSISESYWTNENGITGIVRCVPAGYVATNQQWRFQALKPREVAST